MLSEIIDFFCTPYNFLRKLREKKFIEMHEHFFSSIDDKVSGLEANVGKLEFRLNNITKDFLDEISNQIHIISQDCAITGAAKDLEIATLRSQIEMEESKNNDLLELRKENEELRFSAEKMKSLLIQMGINFD